MGQPWMKFCCGSKKFSRFYKCCMGWNDVLDFLVSQTQCWFYWPGSPSPREFCWVWQHRMVWIGLEIGGEFPYIVVFQSQISPRWCLWFPKIDLTLKIFRNWRKTETQTATQTQPIYIPMWIKIINSSPWMPAEKRMCPFWWKLFLLQISEFI